MRYRATRTQHFVFLKKAQIEPEVWLRLVGSAATALPRYHQHTRISAESKVPSNQAMKELIVILPKRCAADLW
jgi:hypothetical protein